MESIHVNAQRAAEGGASWITIHARTKIQGYVPPAHWRYIGQVRKNLDIPVVANGEIWTREDFLRCQEETQCIHYMLGRGALADPELAWVVSQELGISLPEACRSKEGSFSVEASQWLPLIRQFAEHCMQFGSRDSQSQYTVRRVKQWVKMASLKKQIPWFERIKRTQTLEELYSTLHEVIQHSAAASPEIHR
jgi:tRNA-dihydrouridine synthase C